MNERICFLQGHSDTSLLIEFLQIASTMFCLNRQHLLSIGMIGMSVKRKGKSPLSFPPGHTIFPGIIRKYAFSRQLVMNTTVPRALAN